MREQTEMSEGYENLRGASSNVRGIIIICSLAEIRSTDLPKNGKVGCPTYPLWFRHPYLALSAREILRKVALCTLSGLRFYLQFLNMNLQHFTLTRRLVILQCNFFLLNSNVYLIDFNHLAIFFFRFHESIWDLLNLLK